MILSLFAALAMAQTWKPVETDFVVHDYRRYQHRTREARLRTSDANDTLYQVSSSADDLINPPEQGILEKEIKHVAKGRYVVIPISDKTHGHGTHTDAAVWKKYLDDLLRRSSR